MDRRFVGHALLGLVCLFLSIRSAVGQRPKLQPFITVSERTTRITKPLTEDGYVDYCAAINTLNSVSLKDNAAADLIEMVGVPTYWEKVQREKLRKALGLSVLPVSEDNLKSQYHFARDLEKAGLQVPRDDERFDQLFLSGSEPWTKEEAPFIHSWIEINAKQLDMVDSILAKPGYFEPMMRGRERNLNIVPASYDIAKNGRWSLREILVSRCLLQLGERRFEGAIEDILRIHKLARLGKNAKLASGLIDNTHLELNALIVGVKLLDSTDVDADSLRAFLNSLQQLGPAVTAKDFCLYHRLSHLASTSTCALKSPKTFLGNYGFGAETGSGDLATEPIPTPYCCEVISEQIDWDYLLHRINQLYDRAERIHALPNTTMRIRAIQEFEKDTQQRKINFVHRSQYEAARENDEQQARRQLTEDLEVILNEILTAEEYSTYEELSLRARLDLVQIMVSVRLHEKLHGELPEKYETIKPYFDEELLDPFSEKPYRWKATSEGLEVSSASSDCSELPRAYREIKVTVRDHSE